MQVNRSMPPGTFIPVLVYPDVAEAAQWLCSVFGFTERLRIGNHRVQLCFGDAGMVVVGQADGAGADAGSGGDGRGRSNPPVSHSVMVRVADVDRHYEHARKMNARILNPPEIYPFGERQYTVEDVGGHLWTFSQAVADVPPEEWGGRLVQQCSEL